MFMYIPKLQNISPNQVNCLNRRCLIRIVSIEIDISEPTEVRVVHLVSKLLEFEIII